MAAISKKHNKSPRWLLSSIISIFILFTILTFFLFHARFFSLQTPSPQSSWSLMHELQSYSIFSTTSSTMKSMVHKLRTSVTFLPLKDLRYSNAALVDHTWFMSSLYDTHQEGEVQYQKFPSESSQGRILCIKGNDTHDGSWNYYALAWPEALPYNTTFMKGLTFVSYNHYSYENLWHGLSAMLPFVAWHKMNNCSVLPSRWVLYHWGELRFNMGLWVGTMMEATFDGAQKIERFEGPESGPVCFENAVVMRHNEGGMSRERRMEAYDLMRCKARIYCNMSSLDDRGRGVPVIGMTLFLRTGPRSFKNDTAVAEIFKKECDKVEGCRFKVAHSNNLTFCEQVKLMGMTDMLISPHGAQLTNMFLMERNSSVLEFYPKGWLKLAGVGQYVYRWIASWSGMKHEGSWRDTNGEHCPYPEDDRRCMPLFKNGRIGYDEKHFAEWSRRVLADIRTRKIHQHASTINATTLPPTTTTTHCACN
ncbi:hypothetical protein PIB30_077306 [Stylosanthes scabra]|uniref:Glycosyltransferase 61 catalytic domain-containing protein n=1 Tax=Stylosanthes scabra TaxID=79078 RepID=A0ABU6WS31_9FABA|nr:hypothetical protein [Stylosanthes scabra]